MALEAELLTTAEAAVVAGVEVRDINRLIDEHILPDELYHTEDTRRVLSGACALVRFYYRTEKVLTADERKGAIVFICHEAKDKHAVWAIKRWRSARPHWTYRHDHFLTLNFDHFIAETMTEHDRLEKARALVIEDPQILSGTPVVKGTRVPVHDIAALAAKGVSPAEIVEDYYPSLDSDKVELAILYAKAIPQRGRPRTRSIPTTTVRKTVKRRTA